MLSIMEKLVEVGGGGGVMKGRSSLVVTIKFPDPSITYRIILSIFLIGSQFSLVPPLNSVSDD